MERICLAEWQSYAYSSFAGVFTDGRYVSITK